MKKNGLTKKYIIYVLSREFFQSLLVTYILLNLMDILRTGSISNYFNLNLLLLAILVTGLAMVLSEEKGFRYKLMFKKK